MFKNKPRMFILAAVVGAVICTLIGWLAFTASAENQKEALAKNFLTEIYEVKSHDRYQSLQNKLKAAMPTNSGSVHDAAFEEYKNRLQPLTTAECYESLSANARYLQAGQFAFENGYLFTVKSITLKSSYVDKDKEQFDYTVVISATPENGTNPSDITAEGNLVVTRDDNGTFRVNALKSFNSNIYMGLMVK